MALRAAPSLSLLFTTALQPYGRKASKSTLDTPDLHSCIADMRHANPFLGAPSVLAWVCDTRPGRTITAVLL